MTETIGNVKKKAGDDFPILCRIPGLDPVPWGLGLEHWQEIASILEKAGVHALNIYPRWYESRDPLPQMCVPRNAFVHLAEGIKKAVNIPVITNVRINDPLDAEQIVAAGKADFIGMGETSHRGSAPAEQSEGRAAGRHPIVHCVLPLL